MERSLAYLQNEQCSSQEDQCVIAEKPPTSVTWREKFYRWRQLRRERHALSQLSDDMLKDIGISRDAVRREVRRPFWDDHGWRR